MASMTTYVCTQLNALLLSLTPPPSPLPCTTSLGMLPAATAIADMPTIDPMASKSGALTSTLATLTALLTARGSYASTSSTDSNLGKAVVLSSALPPITAKLAAKIMSGQCGAMKELLADNMTLCHQLEAFPANQHIFTGMAKPRLREIDSPLTWVSCFLAYVAVLTNDSRTRNLLTYGQLVVREAQRHSGTGWIEYDRIFRQHAALSPPTIWHELNPSLHASTVLSYRAGPGKVCGLCHEPDHVAEACAMQVLQPQPISMAQSYPLGGHSTQSVAGPIRRPSHQETLERICILWNRGRCSFPWCKFRHVCKQRGHRAKECQQTPPDSAYKALAGSSSKTATTSSSSQV